MSAVSRNYATALFELAESTGRHDAYGELLDTVAAAVELAPEVKNALMSPRIPKQVKADLVARALVAAPPEFVRWVQAVVRRGRQGLFGRMAEDYRDLVDVKSNRMRAHVTLVQAPTAEQVASMAEQLTRVFGKQVVPIVRQDPSILGGAIVRAGDRVFDGSIRRKMSQLRRRMLAR